MQDSVQSSAKSPATARPRWNHAFKRLWSIHWWMAAGFLAIYFFGIIMVRLPGGLDIRGSMYNIHKSLGVVALGLLLARVVTLLQVYSGKYLKRRPKATAPWIRNVVLHSLLYGAMVVVPVSGIWLSNSAGQAIPLFVVNLPDWFEQNSAVVSAARNLHFWMAYTMLSLTVAHILVQRKYVQKMWARYRKKFSAS